MSNERLSSFNPTSEELVFMTILYTMTGGKIKTLRPDNRRDEIFLFADSRKEDYEDFDLFIF